MSGNSNVDALTQTVIQIVKERKPQTVAQLTSLVKQRLQVPEKEIVDAILEMQNRGRLKLRYSAPASSKNLTAYIESSNSAWYRLTIVTAIVAVVVVFTIPETLYPLSLLRIAFGLIFVLWLPGYTFAKALFPQLTSTETSATEIHKIMRVALSIGLSLALVPMVGLILYYTPLGIGLPPVLLSLSVLIVFFATIGVVREHRAQKEKKVEPLEVTFREIQ